MNIILVSESPLILTVDEVEAHRIGTFDAGAAYTRYLQSLEGEFPRRPLGEFVTLVRESVNPRAQVHAEVVFDYVDLREIDDVYGSILATRKVRGMEIGSTKTRFRQGDILFAKIMPSLANKKVALVTQAIANGVASTEFIVLRKRAEADVNINYLFRALRADQFTRQAVANVTGATGRQRLAPGRLIELHVVLPPRELQDQIGDQVEREFTLRTQASELSYALDDLTAPVLGPTTRRTG